MRQGTAQALTHQLRVQCNSDTSSCAEAEPSHDVSSAVFGDESHMLAGPRTQTAQQSGEAQRRIMDLNIRIGLLLEDEERALTPELRVMTQEINQWHCAARGAGVWR